MKRLPVVLVLVLALAACTPGPGPVPTPAPSVVPVTVTPTTAGPTTPAPPPLARSQYAMTLSLDMATKRLAGTVDVTLANTSDVPWHQVCFRNWAASVLALFGAAGQSSGITAATDVATGRALTVTVDPADASIVNIGLLADLAPGSTTKVTLSYYTDIPQGNRRLGWQTRPGGALIADLAIFYPVLAVFRDGAWVAHPFDRGGESFYSECSDYVVSLTLPDDYVVVSTGDETKGKGSGGLATWTLTAGNVRDVAIEVGNGLDVVTKDVGGLPVNAYYDAGSDVSKQQAALSLEAAAMAIPAYTTNYGPYPYDELDIVSSDFFAGGMEYPAIVRIATSSQDFIPDGQTIGLMGVVAHEIAHQWFYAVVGDDQYDEAWLDEGFASFAADVDYMTLYTSAAEVKAWFEDPVNTSQPPLILNQSIAALKESYPMVYFRGALLLYDLRAAMGDKAFYDMMREYYATYSFKVATTAGFVAVVNKYAGDNPTVQALITANLKV